MHITDFFYYRFVKFYSKNDNMGADGGTIPKRCELIRKKKKKEKVGKAYEAATRWRTCQLSQEPLKKPVVCCKFGRLYNKEAVLEAKIDKKLSTNAVTKHIHSLSDVKELKLVDNRAWKGSGPEKGDVYIDMNDSPWVCPITALPMNGVNVFLVNWACGCVFSDKAYQELKSSTCLGCGGNLDESKLIKLYPDENLLKVYEKQVADELTVKKQQKNEKKRSEAPLADEKVVAGEKRKSVTKGLDEPKKAKKEESSIQDNPNIPKSVKNMFTSSEQAKNQPRAHWVTHNPLYY